MIPQCNYAATVENTTGIDNCQTPPEAVDLIVPYLKRAGINTIWEPAAGTGQYIVRALREHGFTVHATDIITGQDFRTYRPAFEWDMIITNPPFKLDSVFMAQANYYRKPWGMLMKSDRHGVAGCREQLFKRLKSGVMVSDYQTIIPDGRISFEMPEKGWGEDGKGQAQFHTSWYFRNFDLGAFQIVVPYTQEQRRGKHAPFRPSARQMGLFW